MKKIKLAAALGVILFIIPALSAQDHYYSPWTFGIRGGLNISTPSWGGVADNFSKTNMLGFKAGLSAEYAVSAPIFLESGLYFASKGGGLIDKMGEGTLFETRTEYAYSPTYFMIPLKIGYSFLPSSRNDIKVTAGLYAGYGIGGNYVKERRFSDSRETERESAGVFNTLKRFDYGVDLGVDFELNNFVLGMGYQIGLPDIGKNSDIFTSFRNNTLSITIGYKFYMN